MVTAVLGHQLLETAALTPAVAVVEAIVQIVLY
jgi:hypothetical protein